MTTRYYYPQLDLDSETVHEGLDGYPIGDEPGVDVLPDGREVTVYTQVQLAWTTHPSVMHGVGDGIWVGRSANPENGWFAFDDYVPDEESAVRLLVGLKP